MPWMQMVVRESLKVETILGRGQLVPGSKEIVGTSRPHPVPSALDRTDLIQKFRRNPGSVLQFAVVQFDDPVGYVKIFVVVRNHEHGLATRLQLGQQLRVEDILEKRVLVRRPFVEQI